MCVCVCLLCLLQFNLIFWGGQIKPKFSLSFVPVYYSLSLSLPGRSDLLLCVRVMQLLCCLVRFHTTYANILADAGAPALNWNGAAFGVDCKRHCWFFVFKVFFLYNFRR